MGFGSRGEKRWSRWFHVALALQLSWIVAGPEVARAQTGDPPDYREAMEAAQREFEAGNFAAAAEEYARADRLFSNARTQFGLGRSHFELRDYVRAIDHLKAALRSELRPLDEKTRPLAEEHLKLAERSVGRFRIESNSDDLTVSVDGDPVAVRSDRKLMLNPGPRLLEVGASDYESQQRQVIVKGGEDRELSFALEPSTAWYADPWFWVGAGVLIAGATFAIVVVASTEGEGGGVPTMRPGSVGP